jgi:CheY-like chemotaxis protein
MRILIVEDNADIARLTAELLRMIDRNHLPMQIDSIVIAGDLDSAVLELAGADVCLCDGRFPLEAGMSPCEAWELVAGKCERQVLPVRCVVYSADAEIAEAARKRGLVAVTKPGRAAEVYAAVTGGARDSGIEARAGIDMLPEQKAAQLNSEC